MTIWTRQTTTRGQWRILTKAKENNNVVENKQRDRIRRRELESCLKCTATVTLLWRRMETATDRRFGTRCTKPRGRNNDRPFSREQNAVG